MADMKRLAHDGLPLLPESAAGACSIDGWHSTATLTKLPRSTSR